MSENRLLAENKLILLYLVKKMDVPLSQSEITQFVLERRYMDYFTIQQYLAELVDARLLDRSQETESICYTITEEGDTTLSYFIHYISDGVKNEVARFVQENGKRIRTEYSVTATYFPELNNEYLVKCAVYDVNGQSLMELSLTVPTREQAQRIVRNWKTNVNELYITVLYSLLGQKSKPEKGQGK